MITLIRQNIVSKGVIGKVTIGTKTWWTIEQANLGNQPFISCIPPGEYELIPWESETYGPCYIAKNHELNVWAYKMDADRPVNGRYKCLYFHRGNYPRNFKGCGGVGTSYLPDLDMITRTADTCKLVNLAIKEEGSLRLRIVNDWES